MTKQAYEQLCEIETLHQRVRDLQGRLDEKTAVERAEFMRRMAAETALKEATEAHETTKILARAFLQRLEEGDEYDMQKEQLADDVEFEFEG